MVRATLSEILTTEEIGVLLDIYRKYRGTGKFASECEKYLIQPNIERINLAMGQKNDPTFLAYLLESTLEAVEKRLKIA